MHPASNLESIPSEAGVAAALERANTRIEVIDDKPFSVTADKHPRLIVEALDAPLRVQQHVQCDTLDALKTYIENHYLADAVETLGKLALFAAREVPLVLAIFDFPDSQAHPAWKCDTAGVPINFEQRYTRWSERFSKWLTQAELIDLIEENEVAMVSPSASAMLSLAEHLEIHRNEKVVARRSNRDGTGEIRWQCDEGETSTKLPERITIGVPVYECLRNAEGARLAWQIELRLRYRLDAGAVKFMLVPVGLDDVLDQAWEQVVAEVRSWGFCPVVEGGPA